jgi:hypothetical protein
MSDLKVDDITAANANTAITIKGAGTGKVVLGDGNLVFPDADGAAGTFITTNGSAALSFAAAGKIVQVVNTQTGTYATGTTTTPFDDTIPQKTEGTEFMTLAITPTNSSNKLLIEVESMATVSASAVRMTLALFQDATAGALAATCSVPHAANNGHTTSMAHYMTAGTTDATTFKVRIGGDTSSNIYFNGASAARKLGGVAASSITITEISV